MPEKDQAPPALATYVASYQTRVSRVDSAVGGIQRVLTADPRRWFVRFEFGPTPGANIWVGAGGVQGFTDAVGISNLPVESKSRDSPARTAGEWYALFAGVGVLIITEDFYVGG